MGVAASSANQSLTSPGLRLARWAGLVFMIFCALVFCAGVYFYLDFFAALPKETTAWGWSQTETEAVLDRIGLTYDGWILLEFASAVLFGIGMCVFGFFIYFKKQADWFSLYIAVEFVLFGTLSGSFASAFGDAFPNLNPLLGPLIPISWVGIFLIFYLFPDGRFIPRWTRWAVLLLILVFAVDIVNGPGRPPIYLALPLVFLVILGPISQIYRYRYASNALQRQQTKWVLAALGVVFVFLLLALAWTIFPDIAAPNSPQAPAFALLSSAAYLIVGLIPMSIGLAVLRYRLWDIDIIVRKTLVYASLTALLALVYFGAVVLLQELFGRVSGNPNSPLAIVISTLLIAALVNPLRRRIQTGIDQRFFRKGYNQEKTLDLFASQARNEVDVERLAELLLLSTREALEPEFVHLWIDPAKRGAK